MDTENYNNLYKFVSDMKIHNIERSCYMRLWDEHARRVTNFIVSLEKNYNSKLLSMVVPKNQSTDGIVKLYVKFDKNPSNYQLFSVNYYNGEYLYLFSVDNIP